MSAMKTFRTRGVVTKGLDEEVVPLRSAQLLSGSQSHGGWWMG